MAYTKKPRTPEEWAKWAAANVGGKNWSNADFVANSIKNYGMSQLEDLYRSVEQQFARNFELGAAKSLGQIQNYLNDPNVKGDEAKKSAELARRKDELLKGFESMSKNANSGLLTSNAIDEYNNLLKTANDLYGGSLGIEYAKGGSGKFSNIDLVGMATGTAPTLQESAKGITYDSKKTEPIKQGGLVQGGASDILFNNILSGKITPSKDNKEWTSLYENGQASQAQKDAYAKWEAFMKAPHSSDELFKMIAEGTLIPSKTNSVWTSLYKDGRPTQAQTDAYNQWDQYIKAKEQSANSGDQGQTSNPLQDINNAANSDQQKELDAIKSETNKVDLSTSAQLVQKLVNMLDSKSQEPTVSLKDEFLKQKKDLGIGDLESELADVESQLEALNAEHKNAILTGESKKVPLGAMRRGLSEVDLQYSRTLNDLTAQRNSVSNQLNMKYGVLNTMISLTDKDMARAEQAYQNEFNQIVTLTNMIQGIEQNYQTTQEREQTAARANVQIMANLLKDGSISYADMDINMITDLKRMELTAGLPVGFTEFINAAVEEPVVSFGTAFTDVNGNRIQPIFTRDPATGALSVSNIELGVVSIEGSGTPGVGVGGSGKKGGVEDALAVTAGAIGGQCGEYVNSYTGLGLGDSYASKISKMDKTIKKPEAGMVFVMPYKDTGHTGFILDGSVDANGDPVANGLGKYSLVKDSNWGLNEKVQVHVVLNSKFTGLQRVWSDDVPASSGSSGEKVNAFNAFDKLFETLGYTDPSAKTTTTTTKTTTTPTKSGPY